MFDYLTLTMQRKTKRIIKIKDELDKVKNFSSVCYSIFSICLLYIIFNSTYYFNYAISTFNNFYSPASATLATIPKIIFVNFIILVSLIWYTTSKTSRLKSQFNYLRLDIIDSLDNTFCEHSHSCNCKDRYINDMDAFNIDVIFK